MLQLVALVYIDYAISDCNNIEGTFEKLKEIINHLSSAAANVFDSLYIKAIDKSVDKKNEFNNEKCTVFISKVNTAINKSTIVKRNKLNELFTNLSKCTENVLTLLKIFSM